MPTADELLAGASIVDKTLIISNDLRKIAIPSSVTNLGVESDDDVLRLNFKLPRYIGDVDLSVFSIRINYLNAEGEGDIYTVNDAVIGSQYITFSWLVGPNATKYKGETKFNVCLRTFASDGTVDREYNTTIATLPVLEGLEVDESFIESYVDILEQWRRELFGIGDTEEAKIKAASETEQEAITNKGAEVLATIPADYTTAVSMTENADRTKADAIICSTQGEVIRVADSSDDYLRGLKIFGKTTQVTTTGKNLLPTKNGAYGLRNGLRFTDLGDGRVHIEGTATANTTFVYCPFDVNTRTPIPAGTYTVSGSPGAGVYLSFFVYATQETTDILVNNGSICRGASWTFTIENDAYYGAYLYIGSGRVVNETISAQLEIGSVATDYEPYSAGLVSPSPEWPQELISVNKPSIGLFGKNLIQNTLGTVTNSGITYTRNEDGSITLNGTATDNSYYTFDFNNPIPAYNTEMVLSLEGGAGLTSISLGYFRADGTIKNAIVYAENNAVNFMYPDEAVLTRTFLTVTTGKTCNNLVVRPMVRLATTDSTFDAPMEKQTLSLPYSLSAIPVTSGGNYTDANGQQWICDEIDFERGVYIQRVGQVVFDGSEGNWSINTYNYNQLGIYVFGCYVRDIVRETYDSPLLCNKLRFQEWGYITRTNRNKIYNTPNYIQVYLEDQSITTPAEFAQWLVVNPITVQYILATPIEIPLTAEEIEAFRFAHTNFPNTTVLNDAGATMALKYNADTKTWLENLPKATDEQVQAAVDAWLTAHYSSAEGASF